MTPEAHLDPPAQEAENLSGKGTVKVVVAGLVTFAVALVVAAWLIPRGVPAPGRAASTPPVPIAPLVNGRLEQTLIEDAATGWERRQAQERALGRYAWVDRARGVVHIPIDRAIDLVAAEHGP